MTVARWGQVKVIGQGQSSMQNECAPRISITASCEYSLMAVVVGFHCDVISCELARRGSAKTSCSGGVHVDFDRRLTAVFSRYIYIYIYYIVISRQ